MADLKTKRVEDGVYELEYKGQKTTLKRRPDAYFDLTLGDQAPIKGYLKDLKQRFQSWVNLQGTGEAPAKSPAKAQEGSAAPAPAAVRPAAPAAPPAAQEARPTAAERRAAVLREAPPDVEPGVTMSYPGGLTADLLLRSHGARRRGDTVVLFFEDYTGRSVQVSMSAAAAIRHIERVEKMVELLNAPEK